MDRVVLLCWLRDPDDRSAYESFVRSAVLPLARRLSSVRSYEVIAVRDVLEGEGDPPADFLEVIEVTSLDAYQKDLTDMLQTADGQEFEERWQAYIGRFQAVHGEVVR